ncbi:hypothetical protein MKW98_018247 [Papaver atlanticum]|uniref:Uncharacterized protein n=1 Tax=Papaver atlanticum TaxID=357466 RepID=A0AAD4S4X3_9MAGN|nr:hypothetical protein MKW98_018247 [Papaver atlanticum]
MCRGSEGGYQTRYSDACGVLLKQSRRFNKLWGIRNGCGLYFRILNSLRKVTRDATMFPINAAPITAMQENQLRVNNVDYLHSALYDEEEGTRSFEARANYYDKILRICAFVAEPDAQCMHNAALEFERLAWLESNITKVNSCKLS